VTRVTSCALALFAVASLGCAAIPHPSFGPSAESDLHRTLALSEAYASRADFGAADSTLAAFATHFPGSAEALETTYWRALYKLDPSNRGSSVPSAMASLDAYLTDTRPRTHVSEAITLRRLAGQLDALNKLAASATSQAKDANARAATATDAKDTAKPADSSAAAAAGADAEIKRLRDELAKANAELDRIRRRLSQPPPRPNV
jgi:hypothetical protein